MNPTLIDILVLFSFVPVWAGLVTCTSAGQIHERDGDDSATHGGKNCAGN